MSGRLEFWPLVWNEFLKSPLLGHGFYTSHRLKWGASSVDNTYIEVLLGLGLLGLFPIVLALLSVFKDLIRTRPSKYNAQNNNGFRFLWLQLASLFLILFFRSLTGPSFQIHHINLSIFVIIAVSSSFLFNSQLHMDDR
jgi:O-antigen ligase